MSEKIKHESHHFYSTINLPSKFISLDLIEVVCIVDSHYLLIQYWEILYLRRFTCHFQILLGD